MRTSRPHAPWWIGLCALALLGCGDNGRQVAPGDPDANLRITNGSVNTLDVFVDNREVGRAQPGTVAEFDVAPGFRDIHVRERGESFLRYQGSYSFSSNTFVDIDYSPGVTRNLSVFNDALFSIFVIVDGVEIGVVFPNQRSDFFVNPGIRDLSLREEGSALVTFVGTYDFAPPGGNEVEVIYSP